MPRLDLILLPLLGGYIFLTTFSLTKYYHLRLEKQRLIYHSLVSAIFLALLAYLVDYYLLKSSFSLCFFIIKTDSIVNYRNNFSQFIDVLLNNRVTPGLKHSLLMFLISWPLAKILNIFFSKTFAFDYTINKWGNKLEKLIWNSLREKNDGDKLLMITTKSNKVYIGYITELSEPLGEIYLTILPNFSGYRNKENLKIEITTKYTDVIKKYVEDNNAAEIDKKLGITIPVNEVLIISKFDNDIFGRFNSDVETTKERPSLILNFFKFFLNIFKHDK